MAIKIHAQVTGYGPQPGNTQALVIITVAMGMRKR
jgi:hypothetical protein